MIPRSNSLSHDELLALAANAEVMYQLIQENTPTSRWEYIRLTMKMEGSLSQSSRAEKHLRLAWLLGNILEDHLRAAREYAIVPRYKVKKVIPEALLCAANHYKNAGELRLAESFYRRTLRLRSTLQAATAARKLSRMYAREGRTDKANGMLMEEAEVLIELADELPDQEIGIEAGIRLCENSAMEGKKEEADTLVLTFLKHLQLNHPNVLVSQRGRFYKILTRIDLDPWMYLERYEGEF